MKIIKLIFIYLFYLSISYSQGNLPPINLVSIPTAGTLEKGSWNLELHLQKDGGILSKLLIGMSPNFSLGLSYGVQNLIGNDSLKLNKIVPDVHVKYRFLEETERYPAFVFGISTLGFGSYKDSLYIINSETIMVSRYDFKAHGLYAVLSKNWNLLGNLGLHLGASLNLWEGFENEQIPNLLLGMDKDINSSITLLADYDFAINDKNNPSFDSSDKWPGFLNTGIRWSVSDNLQVEICINQMRRNQKIYEMNREFKILYNQYF